MAPCNGTTSTPPKLVVTLPPNHSTLNGTLRWHPAVAPRPLHPAITPWCHVQSAKLVRRPAPLLEVRTPIAIVIWGQHHNRAIPKKISSSNWRSIDFCNNFSTFPGRSRRVKIGSFQLWWTPAAWDETFGQKIANTARSSKKQEFANRNFITLESTSLSVIFFLAIFWYDVCSSTLQLRRNTWRESWVVPSWSPAHRRWPHHSTSSCSKSSFEKPLPNLSHGHGYGGTHLKLPPKITTWYPLDIRMVQGSSKIHWNQQKMSRSPCCSCHMAGCCRAHVHLSHPIKNNGQVLLRSVSSVLNWTTTKKTSTKNSEASWHMFFFWSVPPFRTVSFFYCVSLVSLCVILNSYNIWTISSQLLTQKPLDL